MEIEGKSVPGSGKSPSKGPRAEVLGVFEEQQGGQRAWGTQTYGTLIIPRPI